MKRNTPEHWKMEMLSSILSIKLPHAVGLMEMLFHLTAKQAMHGNIGKIPNDIIAKKCGWDGDADELVNALAKSRWLDECAVERFIVHDWEEHCDDATRKAVTRSGKPFCKPVRILADNVGQCPASPEANLDNVCLPSQAMPSQAMPEPSPPSPSIDIVFQDLPKPLDTEVFKSSWLRWEDFRRRTHSQPIQPMMRAPAWHGILERAPPGKESDFGVSTIRQAMANGWKNLYPQEEKQHGRRRDVTSRDSGKSAGGGRAENIKPRIVNLDS